MRRRFQQLSGIMVVVDTLWDYYQKQCIVLTRRRAYQKNDQAWVE